MSVKRTAASLAVGLLPPCLLLAVEYLSNGTVGEQLSDARLYLSIADNALATGHFIQTSRAISGFVVPPGLPFCLLLLRLLGFGLPLMILVQCLLMGGGCLLLRRTGEQLFGRWGFAAPLVYTLAYVRCRVYLGNLMVEHWYLFLLCLLVRLLFWEEHSRRRLVFLNLAGLGLLLTRPALAPVYLAVLLYTLAVCLRDKRFGLCALTLLLPAAVLGLNLLVNYRETSEWVLLQNYSGADLYRAAAPNAPLTRAESNEFSDPLLDAVNADPSLPMGERSRVLMAYVKTYIRSDPLRFLRNALTRCYHLFLKDYLFLPLLALPGALLMARGPLRRRALASLALNLLLLLLTGFGIPEIRYTMPVWPLASLHFAALASRLSKRNT